MPWEKIFPKRLTVRLEVKGGQKLEIIARFTYVVISPAAPTGKYICQLSEFLISDLPAFHARRGDAQDVVQIQRSLEEGGQGGGGGGEGGTSGPVQSCNLGQLYHESPPLDKALSHSGPRTLGGC